MMQVSRQTFISFIQRAGTQALAAVLPPLCLACDAAVEENGTLCASCWRQLTFIAASCCDRCGAPFELPQPAGALCPACLAQPPNFTRARAALLYDGASRRLILGFKHADQIHATRGLAAMMQRAGAALLASADMIAPVPLHRWRLFYRRYNQAALLAQALSHSAHKPFAPELLRRTRATASQGHMNRADRARNVRDAFALNPRYDVAGKTICLIDDVLTTGATANACAALLHQHGAIAVHVVTLARTSAIK